MKKTSLKDLFYQEKKKPSPAQEFISLVASISGRKVITVRKWIAGQSEPDELVKNVLAKHFNTKSEYLFPKN